MEYFYSQIERNNLNEEFQNRIKEYAESEKKQVYLLHKPLIDSKFEYNMNNVGMLLMRQHKIAFVSFANDNNKDEFEEYVDDVMDDINILSSTFDYRSLIGRARMWKDKIIARKYINGIRNFSKWIDEDLKLPKDEYRRLELIITLLIGSINDVSGMKLELSESIIGRVRQKIQMFDGEQTRFIYGDLKGENKQIFVQGLSGTGKTELLLHKLREIYMNEPKLPIGFTCHNRILADNLEKRIPQFFDFMKVNKQIDKKKLLCVNAWGRSSEPNSGIYRYICDYYKIPFYNLRQTGSFKEACKRTIKDIKEAKNRDNYVFSYILIDECQDFDESFFELCTMVTKEKIYIAGDIFQDIFEEHKYSIKPTIQLSNCYRTDPKTLMIAHALGMGLYEKNKLWWLEDEQWKQCGYIVKHEGDNLKLTRHPIHRFEIDEENNYDCFSTLVKENLCEGVKMLLHKIKQVFSDVTPDDIGIIYLDDESYIYDLSIDLEELIGKEFGYKVNLAYESKQKKDDTIFISNRNNVKGLEFPIVICLTKKIKSSISYRNTLYTMLTRSFLSSYLLIQDSVEGIPKEIEEGIKKTLQNNEIETRVPTNDEKMAIRTRYEGAKKSESLQERLNKLFVEYKITDTDKVSEFYKIYNLGTLSDMNDEKLRKAIQLVL